MVPLKPSNFLELSQVKTKAFWATSDSQSSGLGWPTTVTHQKPGLTWFNLDNESDRSACKFYRYSSICLDPPLFPAVVAASPPMPKLMIYSDWQLELPNITQSSVNAHTTTFDGLNTS